jgi:hypothetical protein
LRSCRWSRRIQANQPPENSARFKASIAGYLEALDQADQAEDESTPTRVEKLQDKIATLRQRMQALQTIGEQLAHRIHQRLLQ